MNSPALVVYDSLSALAHECLGIANDACVKLAAHEAHIAELETKHREALVLTKVASQPELTLGRVVDVVDRMINAGIVKRANRLTIISGIRSASREAMFDILEKFASVAVCPVSALHGVDDGEEVEKAAGNPTDEMSPADAVWFKALKEARAEVGA